MAKVDWKHEWAILTRGTGFWGPAWKWFLWGALHLLTLAPLRDRLSRSKR